MSSCCVKTRLGIPADLPSTSAVRMCSCVEARVYIDSWTAFHTSAIDELCQDAS